MKVDKVTIAVEIKGKPYFVLASQEHMQIAITMIQGLSDNEKLNVAKAPDGFEFTTLGEQQAKVGEIAKKTKDYNSFPL